jgi:hypothetical protein
MKGNRKKSISILKWYEKILKFICLRIYCQIQRFFELACNFITGKIRSMVIQQKRIQ